jgi:hypothetical protein
MPEDERHLPALPQCLVDGTEKDEIGCSKSVANKMVPRGIFMFLAIFNS